MTPDEIKNLKPMVRVKHSRFGLGTVVGVHHENVWALIEYDVDNREWLHDETNQRLRNTTRLLDHPRSAYCRFWSGIGCGGQEEADPDKLEVYNDHYSPEKQELKFEQ